MSTTAPPQVDPTSFDLTGLSVATAAPDPAHPRAGTAYDPVSCAAVAPIWFHPMPGGVAGTHLMVCARTWTAATPTGGGFYGAHTESSVPSWFVVHGPTGARSPVPGFTTAIPQNTPTTDLILKAGASRAPDYLWLLYAATTDTGPAALVQLMRVAPSGVNIYVEETPPTLRLDTTTTVVFDQGMQYDTPYLNLFGTTPSGAIYQIRKPWAEIGTSTQQPSGYTPAWEYFTGDGFSTDPTLANPLTGLTSDGPLSFASFRQMALMSLVTGHTGQVYHSSRGRPYRLAGDPIPLGTGTSYLGHGLMLQAELEVNPAQLLPALDSGAIPYLVTTQATSGPNTALVNTWGLHVIRL